MRFYGIEQSTDMREPRTVVKKFEAAGCSQFERFALRVIAGMDPHRAAEAGRREMEEEEQHG